MEFKPRCSYCKFFEATPLKDDPSRGKCLNPDSDRKQVDATWIPYTKQYDSKISIFNPNGRIFTIKRSPCFEVRVDLEMQNEAENNQSYS